MKLQLERWKTWRAAVEFARHPKADRYTIRAGGFGLSVLVTGGNDTITPRVQMAIVALVSMVAGLLIGGAK